MKSKVALLFLLSISLMLVYLAAGNDGNLSSNFLGEIFLSPFLTLIFVAIIAIPIGIFARKYGKA